MADFQAWTAVIGGFLVHLTLGSIYSTGNMVPYVISYVRAYSKPASVDYSDGLWIFALALSGQGLCMFLGGLIHRKIGPRWTTLIGSAVTSIGVAMTYWSIKQSFYLNVFTYGFLFGIGVGLAYASPLACVMTWMPERKGLVNGIVLAGFGGGAFIFSQIQTAYINPENLAPDETVGDEKYFSAEKAASLLHRVPFTFLLMGGVFAILQLIGCFLMTSPKQLEHRVIRLQALEKRCCAGEEEESLIGGEQAPPIEDNKAMSLNQTQSEAAGNPDSAEGNPQDEIEAGKIQASSSDGKTVDMHPYQVLRTRAFYTLWFMFLLNGQTVVFIATLYKAFGQTFIANDRLLMYVGACASLLNAGGRPIWGHLADKFGFRRTMLVLCTAQVTLMLTLDLTKRGGSVMYFLWICALFGVFCGNFALFPTVTAKTFGQKYVAVNFGLVFTSQVVSGLIGALLTTSLEERVGWFGMFSIIAGCSTLSLLLAFSYNIQRGGRDV